MAARALAISLVLVACGDAGTAVEPLAGLPTAAAVPTVDASPETTSPTPLAVEEISAEPSADSTTGTEPTPAPSWRPLAVKVSSVTKTRLPGQTASVTITTKRAARCSIDVEYESGRSTAKGLGDKRAGSNGKVTWSWTVGRATNPQRVDVYIACSLSGRAGDARTSITVK